MDLSSGFVVADRFEIRRRIHLGTHWALYRASTDEAGPGDVVVRVIRYDTPASAEQILQQREQGDRAWAALLIAASACPSIVPVPIVAEQMYPGDRAWRSELLNVDRTLVSTERYYVTAAADGLPLATYLRQETVDDEHALLLLLRLLLACQSLLNAGLSVAGIALRDLVVHPVARTFVLVDHGALIRADSASGPGELVGVGRVAASLLGGAIAPSWVHDVVRDRSPDWAQWFEARRVPPEYRAILATLLHGDEPADERIDASIHRARALLGIRPPTIREVNGPGSTSERSDEQPQLEGVQVLGRLAQGGRGTILRVRDRRTGLDHALKAGRYQYDSATEFADELPQRRLELEHEYEVLRAFHGELGKVPTPLGLLKAPGVGGWFAIAPDLAPGEPHLLMQKLPGVPLLRLLESPRQGYSGASPSNRLPPAFVLWVVAQLARSLVVIHEAGYLLQDLKTENLIYDPGMELVHLVDLASVCPRDARGRLRRKSVAFGMQTHGFAAPEFAELWEKVDDRFDIYSLGATAYHLLTGINPERVAIDEGCEYPDLKREPLSYLPTRVRDLVARCLDPAERRWASARELAAEADSVRLELSRGRPLDVRDPTVEYGAASVTVSWELPGDRRVTGVLVHDADTGEVVYNGAWVSRVEVAAPEDGTLTLEIFAVLIRNGAPIRSRGRSVDIQRHPEPLAFKANRSFGAHRLLLCVAAHATGVLLCRQRGFPPLSPEEGERVHVLSKELPNLQVPVPDGDVWHYAAFAVYGDHVSAPRFASSDALPTLPSVELVAESIDEQGVHLRWSPPLPGARVEVTSLRSDGRQVEAIGARILATETHALLPVSEPGQPVEWALRVRRNGVDSDILLHGRSRFWPLMPTVTLLPGPEIVLRVAHQDPHIRHLRVEWSHLDSPSGLARPPESPTLLVEDDRPVVLPVRPLTDDPDPRELSPVSVRVTAVLVDGSDGPAQAWELACPRSDLKPTTTLVTDVAPWRLCVAWPDGVDGYELTLRNKEASITVSLPEPEASLGSASLGLLGVVSAAPAGARALEFTGAHVAPGTQMSFNATLGAPSGASLGTAGLAWIHRVQLEPPVATPALGIVTLAAQPTCRHADAAVDVELQLGDGQASTVSTHAERPVVVEAGQGVAVRARWRLHGDGLMPWSTWVEAVTYRVPVCPAGFRAVTAGQLVLLSWESDEDNKVEFEVHAPSGRAVYLGDGRVATDYVAEQGEYRVRASRFGVHSAWVSAMAAGTGSESDVRLSAMATTAATPGRPAASAAIVRAVTANGHGVLEITPADMTTRVWLALRGAAPVPRTAVELMASEGDRVVGAVAGARGRLLMAWRGAIDRVRVVSWDAGASIGVVVDHGELSLKEGELIGVAAHRQTRLQFLPVTRPLGAPIRLQVWLESGDVREVELDELEPIRMRGVQSGAAVATAPAILKSAVAISAARSMGEAIVVPMHVGSAPQRVVAALYNDAASAIPRRLVGALAGELGAALVSWTGVTSVVAHLLVRGMHTEVQCAIEGALQPASTMVRWRIRAVYGGVLQHQRVPHPQGVAEPSRVVAPIADRLRAALDAYGATASSST